MSAVSAEREREHEHTSADSTDSTLHYVILQSVRKKQLDYAFHSRVFG